MAYAEWLAVTYGDAGLRVGALCPQGVRTPLLMAGLDGGSAAAKAVTAAGELLDPDDVAGVVVEGLAAEWFLVRPRPEVSRMCGTRPPTGTAGPPAPAARWAERPGGLNGGQA